MKRQQRTMRIVECTAREICAAAGLEPEGETSLLDRPINEIYFDTRMMAGVESFCLFLAITGPSRSGANFIAEAAAKGAQVIWTDRPTPVLPGLLYLRGKNVLDELTQVAVRRRDRLSSVRFVGITGSNGKTIVKEWIHELTGERGFVSPRSYNSKLGVALSLLAVPQDAPWAVVEAGISHPGDMQPLYDMIRPQLGVMTRFGDAHAENFVSDDQRLAEKCLLFQSAHAVVALKEQFALVARHVPENRLVAADPEGYTWRGERRRWTYEQRADRENAALAFTLARMLTDEVRNPAHLPPVSMRREIINDNPETYILNDSYTSDETSATAALAALENVAGYDKKIVVLSDLSIGNENTAALRQKNIYRKATELFGTENVLTVGPRYAALGAQKNYTDTETLLERLEPSQYKGAAILLKGSRAYSLERLIPFLTRRAGATYLRIDLNALTNNYRKLKAAFGGKLMAMVKAGAYGTGATQTARALEAAGADAFGVAHTQEGVELRLAGVRSPIMVMNPAGAPIENLIEYRLEPAVGDFGMLETLRRTARKLKSPLPVHVEFDTGMGRLGFMPHEAQAALNALDDPFLQPVSVFTHLAAADDPRHDDFTRRQLNEFERLWALFQSRFGNIDGHACNSAGAMRFKAGNMARAGVALYGVGPGLEAVVQLKSVVLQVRRLPAGASVGYGRAQFLTQDSTIATVAVGYADGIPRRAGCGKACFRVAGVCRPTVGRICMDLTMLDVTGTDVRPGDEVEIFVPSLEAFAQKIEAIAYEILARIPARVRRVFVYE
ncbi:MAG: alanine racemase [Bacteroidia bacterium]|nr:alanine racemase [Bacteroidia bacterium]